mmetsp:Transcript_1749/g.3683  ORF Transcript_1749/g.3683 Transcript_1749/m.3683 type:complete len:215 (-) Transcript_1749:87-731(-)
MSSKAEPRRASSSPPSLDRACRARPSTPEALSFSPPFSPPGSPPSLPWGPSRSSAYCGGAWGSLKRKRKPPAKLTPSERAEVDTCDWFRLSLRAATEPLQYSAAIFPLAFSRRTGRVEWVRQLHLGPSQSLGTPPSPTQAEPPEPPPWASASATAAVSVARAKASAAARSLAVSADTSPPSPRSRPPSRPPGEPSSRRWSRSRRLDEDEEDKEE